MASFVVVKPPGSADSHGKARGALRRLVDDDIGAAGAAAAITASRLGATVVLLEKQPAERHYSNTRVSGGMVMVVNDAEGATTYLHECAGGSVGSGLA